MGRRMRAARSISRSALRYPSGFGWPKLRCTFSLVLRPFWWPSTSTGMPVERPEAADDRGIVGEAAIAVQLDEVGHQALDVVERVGAGGVSRELHLLPGRQLGEDLLLQLAGASFEQRDLRAQLGGAAAHPDQLFDLSFELDHRALEVERGGVVDAGGGGCCGFGHRVYLFL